MNKCRKKIKKSNNKLAMFLQVSQDVRQQVIPRLLTCLELHQHEGLAVQQNDPPATKLARLKFN